MSRLAHYVEICARPAHLRRTLAIAAVVGTWLTLYNQILTGAISTEPDVALAVFLNYLTPFVVANWGLVSRESSSA